MKNLGFALDCHLTMIAHASNIARKCYFELRRLSSIRRLLTSTATATLVSAVVFSRIYYCSSLLFGSTNYVTSHLQRIQNYAARVILHLPKSAHITTHFRSLRWLPVKFTKHLQNSSFVLLLSQQYGTIICHRHAAYEAIAHQHHSLQLIHHTSSQ